MLEYLLQFVKSVDWRAGAGVMFGAAISALVSYG